MLFQMAVLQISYLQSVFSHPNKRKLLVQNVKGMLENINSKYKSFNFSKLIYLVFIFILFYFLPLQPEEYKQYAQCWASPHLP